MKTMSCLLATVFAALAAAGEVHAQSAPTDMKAICGDKPAVVALTDGVGDNAWRRIARAGFELEASKCPNIKGTLYADAGGDPQKSNSDINSLVAQGANVIVSFVDFGDAMLPAFRKATKAGVVVVPYLAPIGGAPGKDYAANVHLDTAWVAESWANWMGQNIKKGNLIFIAGAPASPVDVAYQNIIIQTLAKYPDIHLLQKDYLVTNWNPSDAHKAVNAAIAKYGQIDMIIADYSVEVKAAMQAFQEAKLPLPAFATISPSNDLDCQYLADKKAGKGWNFIEFGGSVNDAQVALRRGLADFEATQNPEPLLTHPRLWIDTFAGVDPQCDTSLPPDADLSGNLPLEKVKELLKK